MDNKTYTENTDEASPSKKASTNRNVVYIVLTALIGISLIISFIIFSKKITSPGISKINAGRISIENQKIANDRKIVLNSADISDKNVFDKSTYDEKKQISLPPPTDPYAAAKNMAAKKPTVAITKPTVSPVKPTLTPSKPTVTAVKPTIIVQKPSITPIMAVKTSSDTYTVKTGDNLWNIAQQVYGSGFRANDLAKANKLAQANMIYPGQKIILPKMDSRTVTQTQPKIESKEKPEILAANTKVSDKIQKYTVQKGDNLWNISMHFYGNGFGWRRIADANKLANPRVIHNGNILIIPPKE